MAITATNGISSLPSTIHDLPDAILTNIISAITDVRTRNSTSLVSQRWRQIERSTRTSLSLRGNLRDLFLLPTSFSSILHLDLSHLSPWGHPFLNQIQTITNEDDELNNQHQLLIAHRLHQAFPNLVSLSVYARNSSTLRVLAHHWPGLRHVSLVRWHQRPQFDPPGADLDPLFSACPNLTSLDLSRFYCWTEDIPAALQANPCSAFLLVRLDLLNPAISDGFKSSEIVAISKACRNLSCLKAPCVFNPMHFDFVGDDAMLGLASNCPRLSTLHLVDPAVAQIQDSDSDSDQDSGISAAALKTFFMALPLLEDFALDLCQRVIDAGPALEVLGNRCPNIKTLKLGKFQGICVAAGLHLDGVSVCGGIQSLSIKNSDDLTDFSLLSIARGCQMLSRFEIHACNSITEMGLMRMAGMLRPTLVDVKISGCPQLNGAASLRAIAPIRDRIERLHIDCNWVDRERSQPVKEYELIIDDDVDAEGSENGPNKKKCRYSEEVEINCGDDNGTNGFWFRSWDRLQYLSLWLPAGEILSPLSDIGLDFCPHLEEINIKIEGDCRTCPKPKPSEFGLACLSIYDRLWKMKFDCGDAIGYALTAPMGHMDLSSWERFYLSGIESLVNLYELDYWPPQDREVNQRGVSLPAAALIQRCAGLRKLFIHGTAHEHFMRFFLLIPGLRDVQLREDYYPAPEDDMSTEMRVDSCSRFEDALNGNDGRVIPD